MPAPDHSAQRKASFMDLYRFYRGYLRSDRATLALAGLFLFGAVLMELASPWPLKIVFDYVLRNSGRPPRAIPGLAGLDPMTALLAACAGVALVAAGFGLFTYGHTALAARAGRNVALQIRERLFVPVQRLSLDLHGNRPGDQRLLRDVNQLLSYSAARWLKEAVLAAGMIAAMLWLDWKLALVSLLPLLVLPVSRALGWGPQRRMQAGEILTAAGSCLALGYGALRVIDGRLGAGDLLVVLAYLKGLSRPVRRIATLSVRAPKTLASAERVMRILRTVPEIHDAAGAIPAPRFRGDVEFRGLELEYEPGRPVLSGIDLRVRAGQTVAVVGASGAAKSALVSLIPRLYDPTAGTVLIDGIDVRRFKLGSLRDQVTVVPQEPVLPGSTIRENIAMGDPSCDFPQIQRAARLACAEEFIDRLPNGYDTEVGERASNLSAGQRQRIAVARALLRDAPIVILEEPTAGIDIFSETLVLRGLRNLLRDKTAFVIAQRLSTIVKADLVIVVESGRIVESGAPRQLIQRNGVFRKLAELQFGTVNVERMLLPVYGSWAHGA